MKFVLFAFVSVLLSTISCNSSERKGSPVFTNLEDNKLNGIWQLDYYPDSIFINKEIDNNSVWCSPYAYTIMLFKDSCKLIGWNESWSSKLEQLDENSFKTEGISQYYVIRLISNNKLELGEVTDNKKNRIGNFYPFHRVEKVLSQWDLQKRIAIEIFAGKYRPIFNDTLHIEIDSIITLTENFKLNGFNEFKEYSIETELGGFEIPNKFIIENVDKKKNIELSFSFKGDTLLLNDIKWIYDKYGDIIGCEQKEPRIKLLRIK